MIGDDAIVTAWAALDTAARDRLPEGAGAIMRQRELSTGEVEPGKQFVRDLGHVLLLLDEFTQQVRLAAAELAIGRALKQSSVPSRRVLRRRFVSPSSRSAIGTSGDR